MVSEMPTPYAVEWTDAAIESRRALTDKRQVVVLDIVQQLAAEARNSHGEPGEGRSRVYRDPATMISVTYECDAQNHVIRIVHAAQPQVPVPPQLFISYSHKDKKWLEDLRKYLDFLEEQQLVHIWDDPCIRPGVDWLPALEDALRSEPAGLLLVTQEFLI